MTINFKMEILEKNESRISVRIPKKMRKMTEKKAKALNISISQFIKLALIEKLENNQKK